MAVTYEPIASTTLGSDTTTVTFSSIPGTYTDLFLTALFRDDRTAQNGDDICYRFNGDTGSNYSRTYLSGNGSSASSGRESSQTLVRAFYVSTAVAASNVFTVGTLHIMNYANTNVFKTSLHVSSDAALAAARYVSLWRSTSAVTSIDLFADPRSPANKLVAGCTFSLYGIKAA